MKIGDNTLLPLPFHLPGAIPHPDSQQVLAEPGERVLQNESACILRKYAKLIANGVGALVVIDLWYPLYILLITTICSDLKSIQLSLGCPAYC